MLAFVEDRGKFRISSAGRDFTQTFSEPNEIGEELVIRARFVSIR
jgi:hypothetical protein